MPLAFQDGADGTLICTLLQPDETPVDITGWSFTNTFYDKSRDSITAGFTVAIVDADSGQFSLSLTREQTSTAEYNAVRLWKLWGEDASGYKRKIATGTFEIQGI